MIETNRSPYDLDVAGYSIDHVTYTGKAKMFFSCLGIYSIQLIIYLRRAVGFILSLLTNNLFKINRWAVVELMAQETSLSNLATTMVNRCFFSLGFFLETIDALRSQFIHNNARVLLGRRVTIRYRVI